MGNTFSEKLVDNDMILVQNLLHAVHVPLRKSLKIILEIPNLFNIILNYIKSLSEETYLITNIMQAGLWMRKYAKMLQMK